MKKILIAFLTVTITTVAFAEDGPKCRMLLQVGGGFQIADSLGKTVEGHGPFHEGNYYPAVIGHYEALGGFSNKQTKLILDAIASKGYDVLVVDADEAVDPKLRAGSNYDGLIDVYQEFPLGINMAPSFLKHAHLTIHMRPINHKWKYPVGGLNPIDDIGGYAIMQTEMPVRGGLEPWGRITKIILAQLQNLPICVDPLTASQIPKSAE